MPMREAEGERGTDSDHGRIEDDGRVRGHGSLGALSGISSRALRQNSLNCERATTFGIPEPTACYMRAEGLAFSPYASSGGTVKVLCAPARMSITP
jgi:hypothetical protein